MADFDEQEEYGNYRNDPDLMNDEDLDELDEWKTTEKIRGVTEMGKEAKQTR
mgnify:CR=1 FL=1